MSVSAVVDALLEAVLLEAYKSKFIEKVSQSFAYDWSFILKQTKIDWEVVEDKHIENFKNSIPANRDDYILFLLYDKKYYIRIPQEYWMSKGKVKLAKMNVEFSKLAKKSKEFWGIDTEDVKVKGQIQKEILKNKKEGMDLLNKIPKFMNDNKTKFWNEFNKYLKKVSQSKSEFKREDEVKRLKDIKPDLDKRINEFITAVNDLAKTSMDLVKDNKGMTDTGKILVPDIKNEEGKNVVWNSFYDWLRNMWSLAFRVITWGEEYQEDFEENLDNFLNKKQIETFEEDYF